MLFARIPNKANIQNVKSITINGWKFSIKKINPLLDFTADTMPQIFTAFLTRRVPTTDTPVTIQQLQRTQEEIKAVIQAGLIKPELIPIGKGELRGKESGITVEDLFRDEDTALKLYIEILAHSLNRFKGLRRVFFSIKIKHLLYTEWRKNMDVYRAILSSQTENAV